MNHQRVHALLLVSLLLSSIGHIAWAETPQERAQKIKEWRRNCNDSDPDLRIAYLEGAIATKDQMVKRTCIKQTITSENTDVRNLALRAALASSERLTIEFSMSEAYQTAISKAGDDATRLKKIKKEFKGDLAVLKYSGGILGLTPKTVELDGQKSSWYTMGKNTSVNDQHTINLSVIGDTISGNGQAFIGPAAPFTLRLKLNDTGDLVGEIKIYQSGLLPAKIRLL